MAHYLQAAALRYAANRWPIFLLGRTKRPLANCGPCRYVTPAEHDPQGCRCLTCHGFYAATLDPRAVVRMLAVAPSGMLAIRTGASSGLLVVDVDPGHGGRESLARLVADGLTPPTRYVITGSGGLHLYYRHPGPHVRISCSAGVLGPGIDVRADGGYVVAPPSLHPRTGRAYAWADERAAITEMAPALLTAITAPPKPKVFLPKPRSSGHLAGSLPGAGAISAPDRLMAVLLDRVRNAPPGRRRTTLYGCARGAARIVAAGAITATDAYAALMEVGLAVGQTEKSAAAAINGGFTDEGVHS